MTSHSPKTCDVIPTSQSPEDQLSYAEQPSRRELRAKHLKAKWESGELTVGKLQRALGVARGTAYAYLTKNGPPSERWRAAPEWLRKGAEGT